MRGLRSASGDATTTKRDHTARWDAFHRPSSQRVTASKQYQPKRSFNLATTALRTNGWYRLRGQVRWNVRVLRDAGHGTKHRWALQDRQHHSCWMPASRMVRRNQRYHLLGTSLKVYVMRCATTSP